MVETLKPGTNPLVESFSVMFSVLFLTSFDLSVSFKVHFSNPVLFLAPGCCSKSGCIVP